MHMIEEGKSKGVQLTAVNILIAAAIIAFLYFYGSLLADITLETFFSKEGSFQTFVPVLLNALSLLVGTEIFLIITRYVISKYLENRGKKKEIKLILTLYTYLIWGFVAIFLVTTFFKDVGALLTSIGLIGFGITFALQKPLINFVAWLTIVITKPFNIGDRIEVTGIRGDVVNIHTMYTSVIGTRLNTHEKNDTTITIPNELILTNAVINYSKRGNTFIDETVISITYESNWKKAIELLEKAVIEAITKHAKKPLPATFAEKRAWQEALKLLTEASKKLRRSPIKDSVKEQIDQMKSVENAAPVEVPKPSIQMSLGDSSINISATYQTDLYSVRSTKHEIIRYFFEMAQKEKDIEIAYPHMQLVYGDKTTAPQSNVPGRQRKIVP